jgi:hypothetical protein
MPLVHLSNIAIIVVVCLILGGIIGYAIGFGSGSLWALNWGLKKAVYFLDLKGIKVEANTDLIAQGIFRYQNNIGGCWDIENRTT